jgi:hypothetical protein
MGGQAGKDRWTDRQKQFLKNGFNFSVLLRFPESLLRPLLGLLLRRLRRGLLETGSVLHEPTEKFGSLFQIVTLFLALAVIEWLKASKTGMSYPALSQVMLDQAQD